MNNSFLHLGDLHLGIKFHKRSLIMDQKYVLDQVVAAIRKEGCNLVIAGDIFDTVNPSIEAQELWYDFLSKLAFSNSNFGCETFIIPGNHDSAARLALDNEFLEESGIHILGKDTLFEVFPMDTHNLVCIPFIKPEVVNYRLGLNTKTYTEAFYEVAKRAKEKADKTTGFPCILVAHQSFEGCKAGESEFKPFMSDSISLDAVKDFDKVWAGHIHGHQILGNVVYSGSLLPYAFGDAWVQSVSFWKLGPDCAFYHQRIPMSILHPLTELKGDLKHCLEADVPEYNYVKVRLQDCADFDTALSKLQERFSYLCCVTNDDQQDWVADLDKPIGNFSSIAEALGAFCDHLEIPRFTGKKEQLIKEAIDAYSQIDNK